MAYCSVGQATWLYVSTHTFLCLCLDWADQVHICLAIFSRYWRLVSPAPSTLVTPPFSALCLLLQRVCCACCCSVPRRQRLLSELLRVVRPGCLALVGAGPHATPVLTAQFTLSRKSVRLYRDLGLVHRFKRTRLNYLAYTGAVSLLKPAIVPCAKGIRLMRRTVGQDGGQEARRLQKRSCNKLIKLGVVACF